MNLGFVGSQIISYNYRHIEIVFPIKSETITEKDHGSFKHLFPQNGQKQSLFWFSKSQILTICYQLAS